MFIVDFDSSIWSDPWFRKLPSHYKLLFIYLWTNNHKNNAGLYAIDIETISFETGLSIDEVKDGFQRLLPKVKYDFDNDMVWVVNHVKCQFMKKGNISKKMIPNFTKALLSVNRHHFIDEFLEKYSNLEIPYPCLTDTVSVVSGYPPGVGVGVGGSGGEGKDSKEKKKEIKKRKEFDQFWVLYPRKQDKKKALQAWERLDPGTDLQRKIINFVRKARDSKEWNNVDGQYIPHATTFLTGRRWEDELTFNDDKPRDASGREMRYV